MNPSASSPLYLATYYVLYLGLCAVLIAWLGRALHRSGAVVLQDAFGGNTMVALSVARLLDIGFYLVSVGYVAITYRTFWQLIDSYRSAIESAVGKAGGFMLLLGFAHVLNLLILAIFRRRGAAPNGTAGA